MEKPLAYTGKKPYIFVSYAHKDSGRVWPIIARLQKDGFRVWYDEGIEPGVEWADDIDRHLCGCGYFLVFLTRAYLASDNCKDELNRSCDVNIENRLLIYLENVKLEGGMALRNSRQQAIFWGEQASEDGSFAKLYSAKNIESCLRTGMPSPALGLLPEDETVLLKNGTDDPSEDQETDLLSEDEEETELLGGTAQPLPRPAFRLELTDLEDEHTYEADLNETVKIGRSQKSGCQIVLTGQSSVSREHCRIRLEDGILLLQDAGSKNGTFLDGIPVIGEVVLPEGSVLTLGKKYLRVRLIRD